MKLVILGAGLMARGAAFDFLKNPTLKSLKVADASDQALEEFRKRFDDSRLSTIRLDAKDGGAVRRLLDDADGAFCAIHYGFNVEFAKAAIETKTHMVDLGGNNDIVAAELAMCKEAEASGISIIPDCGLAPGMVSVLTAWGLKRFDWADGRDVPVMADKGSAEYLVWVGCAGAFDDRAKKIVGSWLDLLEHAGVDYAVLGGEEACTGDPARRLGDEALFQSCRSRNLATLRAAGARKVITHCPHCLNTFRNEYRENRAPELELVHHSQLIGQLIAAGGVTFPEPDVTNCGGVTAFMKICHLAESFNLPVTSHGAHDLTVHLLAAAPNRSYLEAHGFGLDRFIAEPLRITEGRAITPDRAGHGIEFDWKALDALRAS